MYIGIDLGGTNIAAGVVSENGEILQSGSIPTGKGRNADEIVKDMAYLANKLIADYGIEKSDIKGVGIGVPGATDYSTGTVNCVNVKMDDYPLEHEFRKILDVPVFVDNDANCAAMGEYTINGKGCKDFLLITLGTGVGGGFIINGDVYRGFNGAALEVGHMAFASGGILCSCGRKGCWEKYASVTALIEQTRVAIEKNPTSIMKEFVKKRGKVSGRTAFEAAKVGDKAAQEVVDRYATYIAEGIVSLENIFQPEVITIGGGISREGDSLLEPIKKYVEKYRFNKYLSKTKITTAKLFNDAGIIGAAMIAVQK